VVLSIFTVVWPSPKSVLELFFKDFIYLRERESDRERWGGGEEEQRERGKQTPAEQGACHGALSGS